MWFDGFGARFPGSGAHQAQRCGPNDDRPFCDNSNAIIRSARSFVRDYIRHKQPKFIVDDRLLWLFELPHG